MKDNITLGLEMKSALPKPLEFRFLISEIWWISFFKQCNIKCRSNEIYLSDLMFNNKILREISESVYS